MPKVSGKDIVSDSTEKSLNRMMAFSAIAILAKAYGVPLDDMSLLGMKIPGAVFDVSLLVAILYFYYSFVVKWVGDLMAFRLWYSESSLWSEFGTQMKLDKSFIRGGIDLLVGLHQAEQNKGKSEVGNLGDDARKQFEDFKTNVELYAMRLESAGKRFSALSWYGHFYVWFQSFLFPTLFAMLAIYLLVKYGTFSPPSRL